MLERKVCKDREVLKQHAGDKIHDESSESGLREEVKYQGTQPEKPMTTHWRMPPHVQSVQQPLMHR